MGVPTRQSIIFKLSSDFKSRSEGTNQSRYEQIANFLRGHVNNRPYLTSLFFFNSLIFFSSNYTPTQDTLLLELPLVSDILSFYFIAKAVTVKNISKIVRPPSIYTNRGCEFWGRLP